MSDEREFPREESDDPGKRVERNEDVEAHTMRLGRSEEDDPGAHIAPSEEDDEVEAHQKPWGPSEEKIHKPME